MCSLDQQYQASYNNMSEMQILRPHPRPTKSETQEMESSSLCFNNTLQVISRALKLGNNVSGYTIIFRIFHKKVFKDK